MKTLVIAPRPDDEVLGCGRTPLLRSAEGAELGWLIVTGISEETGWPAERDEEREKEITRITNMIRYSQVYNLRLPSAKLDNLPVSRLIDHFSNVFKSFQPGEVFLLHYSDVHTDHRVVFESAVACTKWFRNPAVKWVLAYETISETDFSLRQDGFFHPNVFVNISGQLESKIELMTVYKQEMADFPFPRSAQAIRAQATLRGSQAGYNAAEAYQLLKEKY